MKSLRWPALLAVTTTVLVGNPASAQTPAKNATNEKPRAAAGGADLRGMGRSTWDDPYELSVLDEHPVLLNGEEISRVLSDRYPADLRDQGLGGRVVLRFVIQPDGTVAPASVTVEWASSPAFVEAAAGVVRQMRFRPGMVGTVAVRTSVMIPIDFKTEEPETAADSVPPER